MIKLMENDIFVAPSYAEGTPVSCVETDNATNKRYIDLRLPCHRCGGSGKYSFNYRDGTMCLACKGKGTEIQTVRVYTEKEYNKLIANKAKAAQRKEAEKQKKFEEAVAAGEKAKPEVMQKWGFSAEGKAYLIYGDDTYAIKDTLKEKGARFNPVLKWYVAAPIDLPEGYKFCEINFDEVYHYAPATKYVEFLPNAMAIVAEKINRLKGPSTSEFFPATEGTRLRDITVKVSKVRGFQGNYGYTYVYEFQSENYIFIWMTTKQVGLEAGDVVIITGTIKKFDEYMGEKKTHLTRCVVSNPIGE